MNFRQNYWLFQALGWTVYTMSEFISYFLLFEFDDKELENLIFNVVVNILLGITTTHYFREIFKKNNWIKLTIPRFILRILISFVVLTLVMTASNIYIDNELIDTTKSNVFLSYISYFIGNGKPLLIWLLIYLFYAFTMERRNDIIEKIQMKASIDASEAKILRAQINPHFMFNALNSIRALILEDPSKAQTGISQLSNILRSALVADRKTTISLSEELKTIEDYLGLEKVRYEERLQIKWEIEEETKSLQVPPMMLQTLVENAIKHGVQQATKWGFIEIRTETLEGNLNISIRNTGELKRTENKAIDGGFGLQNTQRRLNLQYGLKAKFDIFQEDNNIVCARVSIPLNYVLNKNTNI
jgi:two-component system, LytTR family, sensor kinase